MSDGVKKNVLVTGAGGAIGRRVCAELILRGHRVVGFDLNPREALPADLAQQIADWHTGSIADAEPVRLAARGVDSIVHLAGYRDDTPEFMEQILPSNLAGVYHLFEAAREAGVKRVVFSSTCQVGTRHKGPYVGEPGGRAIHPVTDGTQPSNLYAASKIFGEAVGQVYAIKHGMTVFAVRVAWMPRNATECQSISEVIGGGDGYLSPRDAGRYFACAIEAPDPVRSERFSVMYATSRPINQRYELDTPRRLIGYEPMDTWPGGTEVYGFQHAPAADAPSKQ